MSKVILKHNLGQGRYRYLHSILDSNLIHTTAEKHEAKQFKNAKVLKGIFRDKDIWEREYVK